MKKKIYIVEDNEINIKLYQAIFKSIPNLEVLIEKNGKTGLETIKSGDPDVIILDNQLPGMCGVDICKELRKIKRFENIPILAISSSPLNGNREQFFLDAGFTAVLTKPFNVVEFRETIQKLIN